MNSSVGSLSPLTPATSIETIESCQEVLYSAKDVKEALLNICTDLLALHQKSNLSQRSNLGKTPPANPYTVSLATLYNRLATGKPSPAPYILRTNTPSNQQPPVPRRAHSNPLNRPVEDFEYLYYAVLAKINETSNMLTLRVNNGFAKPDDAVFEGGPTLRHTHTWLQESWTTLNDPALVKVLDEEVRRTRVRCMRLEIMGQYQRREITHTDMLELSEDLRTSLEAGEVPGLAPIGGWAPSMIGAWLEEKFRVILKAEKEQDEAARQTELEIERQKRNAMDRFDWLRAHPEAETQWDRERMLQEFVNEAQSVAEDGKRLRDTIARHGVDGNIAIPNDNWLQEH